MDKATITELMAKFDQSSLREMDYQTSDVKLYFSKNEQARTNATEPKAPIRVQNTPVEVPLEPVMAQDSESEVPESAGESPVGEWVTSPIVGISYLAQAPDKPNFVKVGDRVTKGQTLLIIEAMKVMNEIPSPKDGVVTEIKAQNEAMVEFGSELVRID